MKAGTFISLAAAAASLLLSCQDRYTSEQGWNTSSSTRPGGSSTKNVPATEIQLDSTVLNLDSGTSKYIKIAKYIPANTTNRTPTWESTDTKVARVVKGTVEGIAPGICWIKAKCGDVADSCLVNVITPATRITLSRPTLEMEVLEKVDIVASVEPAGFSGEILWETTDENIGTVGTEEGVTLVSALKDGTATISATVVDTLYKVDGEAIVKKARRTIQAESPLSVVTCVEGAVFLGAFTREDGSSYRLFWADKNLGAETPEDYGAYYAWGETQPKTKEDSYDWSCYKWANGAYTKITKYCTAQDFWDGEGSMDGKSVLDKEDDAAGAALGGRWRIPTREEWSQLRKNLKWEWITTESGIRGRRVSWEIGPDNVKSIFLPAAGYMRYQALEEAGVYGYYWSSNIYEDHPCSAHRLAYDGAYLSWDNDGRDMGRSVRPVIEYQAPAQ